MQKRGRIRVLPTLNQGHFRSGVVIILSSAQGLPGRSVNVRDSS